MLDNISPQLWGESFWKTIHYVCLSYPVNPSDDDRANVITFLKSVQFVLPCQKCRVGYEENLTKFPLSDNVLSSKNNLFEWSVNVHNEVNKKNGKSVQKYDDIMKQYLYPSNSLSLVHIFTIIFIIVLIVLLVIFVRY